MPNYYAWIDFGLLRHLKINPCSSITIDENKGNCLVFVFEWQGQELFWFGLLHAWLLLVRNHHYPDNRTMLHFDASV